MTILRTHHHDGTASTSATAAGEGYDGGFGTDPTYVTGGFSNECLEYPSTNNGAYYDSLSAEYLGLYLRIPAAVESTCNFASPRNSSNANLGYLTLDPGGTISIRQGGTRVATSATVLSVDKWYRLEWHAAVSAGTQELRIYDPATSVTPIETLTGSIQSGAIDSWLIGQITSTSVRFQLDEVCVADAWPALGVEAVTTVRPDTVVANPGAFTNVGGAADIPTALGDDDDDTYAQSPDSPSAASLTVGVPALAEGDVTVKVRHAASAASPSVSRKYELLSGSTVITTKTVTLPSTVTAYQFTTTTAETANISDFSDLRLRITDTVA